MFIKVHLLLLVSLFMANFFFFSISLFFFNLVIDFFFNFLLQSYVIMIFMCWNLFHIACHMYVMCHRIF